MSFLTFSDLTFDPSAYYVFGIPFGIYLAFSSSTHMGLSGLWVGMTVALIYCAGFGVAMSLWTPDWEEEARKVGQRVEEEGGREREREEREQADSAGNNVKGHARKKDRRWMEAEEGRISAGSSSVSGSSSIANALLEPNNSA